jgi:hypothetical protein
VASVDEAEIGVCNRCGRGEGNGVTAELMDAVGCRMVEEGEACGRAGEPDPFAIAFAEGFYFGFAVLFREVEGIDVGFGRIEGHGKSADSAKGPGFEDFLRLERADDGGEQGVGNDEAETREANGVDRRKDDLAGLVAAEKCRQVGVFYDGEGIAGIEGVLADTAAKLDDVTASLAVCQADRRQLHQIAKHGEEMPVIDSIAARLWGRFLFHLWLSVG